nr:pentatricopeptide repeat-containing protein [Quercus suber]
MICTNIGTACYTPRGRNFFLDLLNKATTLSQLYQTHAQIILHGLHHDLSTLTKLTHKLSDFKAIHHARLLFLSTQKPDLFLFNVLIKGFSTNHSPSSAVSLYTHLRTRTTLKPDNFTYAFAISAASGLELEKFGLLLHANAVVDGFGFSLFVGSAVVDFYFKFSRIEMARKVFDLMPERDTVLWNTMVSGLVRNCCFGDSIEVFQDMVKGGVKFDSTTLATVLPAAAELRDLGVGMGIQCLALKLGYDCDEYVTTGLVSLYSKCGEIDTARWLFRQIDQPDLIVCNAMISGYTCNGETESSVRLFGELLASGQKVNSSTLVGLIPVFSPFRHLQLSCCIHGFCVKCGGVSHASVSTALTTVYSRLNEIESARLLFDETPEKMRSWPFVLASLLLNLELKSESLRISGMVSVLVETIGEFFVFYTSRDLEQESSEIIGQMIISFLDIFVDNSEGAKKANYRSS